MRFAPLIVALLVLAACVPPSHKRHLMHKRGGRTLPELILGGWDGRELRLFNGDRLRPGQTRVSVLVDSLGELSNREYGSVFLDSEELDADLAEERGFFCDAPWCVVVFERGNGWVLEEWGNPLAIFELSGVDEKAVLGNVWLVEQAIRPPGPSRWELMCRDEHDMPRFVHPEGSAYFPARSAFDGEAWAFFGSSQLADDYLAGLKANDDHSCERKPAHWELSFPAEDAVLDSEEQLKGEDSWGLLDSTEAVPEPSSDKSDGSSEDSVSDEENSDDHFGLSEPDAQSQDSESDLRQAPEFDGPSPVSESSEVLETSGVPDSSDSPSPSEPSSSSDYAGYSESP